MSGNPDYEPHTLGLGLGLRATHFGHITSEWPELDWFEAISENFMDSGGRPRYMLRQIAERYPIVLHGVSMSIGSTSELDRGYLTKLKALADEVDSPWVSDHLCWTGVLGTNSHDLLPLPLNDESLDHVAARVRQVQDFIERPLVLENPSTYLSFSNSTIPEPEFLRRLCDQADCGLLLDVNNVFVTCFNADLDPFEYLKSFPFDRVQQMHLAGHQHCGTHIIDTHDRAVSREVWELYRYASNRLPQVATLLEWDGNVPSFDECVAELNKAKQHHGASAMIPGVDQSGSSDAVSELAESVSNPVDFLVPRVMDDAMFDSVFDSDHR